MSFVQILAFLPHLVGAIVFSMLPGATLAEHSQHILGACRVLHYVSWESALINDKFSLSKFMFCHLLVYNP